MVKDEIDRTQHALMKEERTEEKESCDDGAHRIGASTNQFYRNIYIYIKL